MNWITKADYVTNRRSNEEVWYMKAPHGKNEIGKFLSTAAKNAGLYREGKSNLSISLSGKPVFRGSLMLMFQRTL